MRGVTLDAHPFDRRSHDSFRNIIPDTNSDQTPASRDHHKSVGPDGPRAEIDPPRDVDVSEVMHECLIPPVRRY
jgi:hypothetical protein